MRRLIFWSLALTFPTAIALGWWLGPWWELLMVPSLVMLFWATLKPRCDWWGERMCSFRSRTREALLTFDNAPDTLETQLILDSLDEYGAKALFFFTGVKALRHPELVKLIVSHGHGIGIHGMSYDPFGFPSWMPWRLRSEVETCLRVLDQIIPGVKVQWFRAPGGRIGPWVHPLLAKNGLQLMDWSASDLSARTRDFEKIVIQLRKDIDQGAIISLHHGHTDKTGEPLTPDLVRELLLWLKGQGYNTGSN